MGIDAGRPQTYLIGATLANGASVTEIYTDHVVLRRDGIVTSLYLQTLGRESRKEAQDLLTVSATVVPAAPVRVSVDVFSRYIRSSPVFDGALLRGYQIFPGRDGSVFYQMGLSPADVITALDNQTLSDPQQATEIFRRLAAGSTIAAEITRGGHSESKVLNGALITAAEQRLVEVSVR